METSDLPVMCPSIPAGYFERNPAFPVFTGWYECRMRRNYICWTQKAAHAICTEPYVPEPEVQAA